MTFYDALLADAATESEPLVRVERSTDRAVVTLDDPDKRNVLSAALTTQLKTALEELISDRGDPGDSPHRDGSGFSAGGDLRMMDRTSQALAAPAGTTDIWRWIRYQFGAIARLIAHSDTAFIAALNGPAAGVGLAWALTCDIVIASERAVIVPAFGKLGLLPEVGTSWALNRRLGYQGAFAYYVAGEHLNAERAMELGLVQEVVAHDELLNAAHHWCTRIASLPPDAVPMTKPLLRAAADASWDHAIALEEFAEPQCFTTHAFQESVQSLLGRR
ncbi:MAG: enoyl-CoA hydratase/isomerase family protein [Solirubrobacteraceae bacterium]